MVQVEAERDETLCMIAALEKHRDLPRHLLTKHNIEYCAVTVHARLRKSYMHQLVNRIEVGDRQIGAGINACGGRVRLRQRPAAGVPVLYRGGGPSRTRTCDQSIMSRLL